MPLSVSKINIENNVLIIKFSKFIMHALILYAGMFGDLQPAYASSPDISYIQRDISAAAVGMGNAYSTITEDSYSMHYNPAALYGLKKVEVGGSSSRDDFDRKIDSFNYTFLNGYKKRAYGGLTYIKDEISGIEGRDINGNLTGTFTDKAEIIGYGIGNTNNYLKSQGISYGFLAKYLKRGIMSASASGYGLDLGLLKEEKNGQRFALTVRNAVGEIKWSGTKTNPKETLGRDMSLGYSTKIMNDGRAAFELINDSTQRDKWVTAFGVEKQVSDTAVLRAGCYDGQMAYGAGFLMKQTKIDYAYTKRNSDDLHKFSAIFYFNENGQKN